MPTTADKSKPLRKGRIGGGGSAEGGRVPAEKPREGDASDFRIGFYVHDVSRMRRTLFDYEMKPLQTTRSQWWVLAQLSRSEGRGSGEGMLQTELAQVLDVGKVAVGGLVNRLEASGFVERRPDKSDGRAKRVVMTRRGREVLDQMVATGHRLNVGILKDIAPDELRIAEKVLSKMKSNLRTMLRGARLEQSEES